MLLDCEEDDFMDPNKWPCLSAIAKCFSSLCKGGDDLLTSHSGRGRLIMVWLRICYSTRQIHDLAITTEPKIKFCNFYTNQLNLLSEVFE